MQSKELATSELAGTWKFRPDPDDEGRTAQWHSPGTDDSDWADIRVDVDKGWESQGFADHVGTAWYRLTVEVPAGLDTRNCFFLLFGGVDKEAEVYVNGQKACEHTCQLMGLTPDEIWDRPFAIDARPWIAAGRENLIAVRVHSLGPLCGVWRPVYLVSCDTRASAGALLEIIHPTDPNLLGLLARPIEVRDSSGARTGEIPADRSFLPYRRFERGDPMAGMTTEGRVFVAFQEFDEAVCGKGGFRPTLMNSTDGGRTWESGQARLDHPAIFPQCFTVTRDNALLLAYSSPAPDVPMETPFEELLYTSHTYVGRSTDGGNTWSSARLDLDPYLSAATYGGFCQLPDGTLLMTMSLNLTDGHGRLKEEWLIDGLGRRDQWVYASKDDGRSWPKRHMMVSNGSETHLVRLRSGKIISAIRCIMVKEQGQHVGSVWDASAMKWVNKFGIEGPIESIRKRLFLMDSDDDGRTWHSLRQVTPLEGDAPGELLQLPDGRVLLLYCHRYPGSITYGMLSEDEGKTWAQEKMVLLEGQEGVNSILNAYSSSVLLKDGTILTILGKHRDAPAQAVRWKVPASVSHS